MQRFFKLFRTLGLRFIDWTTSASTAVFVSRTLLNNFYRNSNNPFIDISEIRRVLVVRVDEIGDMVMTTPFLRELRRLLPDSSITLVVNPVVLNLVEHCPYINEVLTFDPVTAGRLWKLRRYKRALELGWNKLRHYKFDLAIFPRWDIDDRFGAFILYYSCARWRVGYSQKVNLRKNEFNAGADQLFTHVLNSDSLKHEVEHNLDFIRFLGGRIRDEHLELWIGREDEEAASKILHGLERSSPNIIVGLGPSGGNSALKQWPIDNFVELGKWLQSEYNSGIVIFGGPGEESLGYEIEKELGFPVTNVIGKMTLREMAALMKMCHLYVGNDTGPMHVATAMNIPVISIFGSSCHHRFKPWGENNYTLCLELPCSPCFQGHETDRCNHCIYDYPVCLHGISVDRVRGAVSKHLSNNRHNNTALLHESEE